MAKETEGGTWINVNGNEKKVHVNIYDSDPKEPHDESIHINIDYDKETFNINEKSDGEKSTTDCSCYLTSACMKHFQGVFNDSCDELMTLRWFRDKFVSKEDIEHYYITAPIIVSRVDSLEDNSKIYDYIYGHIIKPCVSAIKNGDYDFAYDRYKSSVVALEDEFAKPALKKELVKSLKLKTN